MPGQLNPNVVVGCTTIVERAYLAGFFDADGHSNVRWNTANNGKKYPMFHITIGQKDPAITTWLQERFGGNIYKYDPTKTKQTNVFHQWSIVGTRAYVFYLQIRPYVMGKAEQLDTAARTWYEASPKPLLEAYKPMEISNG